MNYYGYKLHEVKSLKINEYNTLAKLMYINEARDTLKGFDVAVFPKLNDDKRKSEYKKHSKIAYPQNFEVKNVVKLGDLTKVLNG